MRPDHLDIKPSTSRDFWFVPGLQQNPIQHKWDFAPFSFLVLLTACVFFLSAHLSVRVTLILTTLHSTGTTGCSSSCWEGNNLPGSALSCEIIENKKRCCREQIAVVVDYNCGYHIRVPVCGCHCHLHCEDILLLLLWVALTKLEK